MNKNFIFGITMVVFIVIVVVFGLRNYILAAKYESGLKLALDEVRKDFGLEYIMWPPRSGKFEGLNYSEKNSRIIYDRCLIGDVIQENVAESYKKSFDVNDLAELTGRVTSSVKGKSTVKRSADAQLILSGLYSRRISNPAPTFDDKCSAKDYFPSDPIYQYVLYAKEFRISVNLGHDDAQELSQKKDIKGVGEIDFDVELSDSLDSTIFLTASNVALGYKKATPTFLKKQYTASCSINTLCEFGDSEYSVVLQDIDYEQVTVIVNNELLGVDNESVQLSVGRSHTLRRFPAARDVITVKDLDIEKGRAKLRVLVLRWQVERGNIFGEEKPLTKVHVTW